MNTSDLLRGLKEMGWNPLESTLYLKLLEMGPQHASTVATQVRRPRVTIYHALERMASKGLTTKRKTPAGWQYAATDPPQLLKVLDMQYAVAAKRNATILDQMRLLTPELQLIQSISFHKPSVEVFEGEDALNAIYELSLDTKTMAAYFDPWPLTMSEWREIDDRHTARRIQKKIPVRILLPASKEGIAFAQTRKPLKESIVIPQDHFSFKDITIITDTRMLIFSSKDKMGVSIESPNIAQNQQEQFQLAWERAKEVGDYYGDSHKNPLEHR